VSDSLFDARPLASRLAAIAARDLADRTITPGEAEYLLTLVNREPAVGGEEVEDDA
jgi:hypothetical protein